MNQIESFIRKRAAFYNMDPDVVMRMVMGEGGVSSPNLRSRGIERDGRQEASYGPLQLNVRRGVGAEALKVGIDPRDPNQWMAATDFGLHWAATHGWGDWVNTRNKLGYSNWTGIGGHKGGRGDFTTATSGPVARAGEGFDPAAMTSFNEEDLGDPRSGEPKDFYSTLADELSSSVDLSKRASGRDEVVSAPLVASGGEIPSTPEFAPATPEEPMSEAAPELAPLASGGVSPLAELFKLPEIGMAGATDPKTGMPVVARQRRTMG